VLHETQQLSVEVAGGDGVDLSDNSSKDQIIVLLQTCVNICDEFVVTKRDARRCELICIMHHLSIVIRDRELILLCSSKGNARVHGSCTQLQ
jgi:hypothetical protein